MHILKLEFLKGLGIKSSTTAELWTGLSNPNQADCSSLQNCDGLLEWRDGTSFSYESWMDDHAIAGTGPNYRYNPASPGAFSSDGTTSMLCQVETTKCMLGNSIPRWKGFVTRKNTRAH